MQKQSPMLRLWRLGTRHHSGLVRAIVSASLGVLGGMLPYFAAAQIIIGLLSGRTGYGFYAAWCLVALAGFCLRALLYALALSMSHKATFSILKEIRERILQKLPKMPLGTVMDTPSGEMKQVIVDQVESMERPLAHLLPEMTSNLLAPVCILLYLFFLDWRMALLSMVSIPVGMALMMGVMKNYGKQYEGSVKVTQAMNATIVEYIGGIEVIKAFNQGKNSYAKFAQRVRANAAYFYNWMKSCQLPISFSKAISPTTLITILPVGWLLYQGGSLSVETFITVIILSLGIAGPLLAAMDFVDSLAKVGTIVGEVDAILNGEEQLHATRPVSLPNRDIAVEHVSFGYHEGEEILHDVSLSIPSGSMVAFVGRPQATHEEVVAAAKKACCHDFIMALPDGYDTVIGGGGAHLSGGERQRIAIARAMLKNAPIVILDEATAYIDPENEDKLQQAMEALTRDKTILMIAHRLKTVRKADQILVLDKGRIVQRGTHAELAGQPGLYRDFLDARREAAGWKLS